MVIHRRTVVLTLGLIVAVALLGRWALGPQGGADQQSTHAEIASTNAAAAPPKQMLKPETVAPSVATRATPAPSASGALRGRVIDAATRQPVREFELELQRGHAPPGGPAPGVRGFRTKDGRFEWSDVQPGQWTLFVNARGYQRFELANVTIANSARPELLVPLRAGYTLHGRVYDEATSLGIAAADISYRAADSGRFEGNWRSRARIVSGKDGSFAFDGLPPGRITMMVHAREYAGRELEVTMSADTAPVEVGLVAGALIAGRLTAADGVTAVVGQAGLYRVDEGYGGIGQTGPGGEFRYEHLEPGKYRLVGRSGGARVEQEITLAPNQRIENIVLALEPGSSIRGVVSGLRPEELERVSISVRRGDGLDHEFFTNEAADRNGAFEVQGVDPGRVQVVADLSMRRQVWKTIDMPPNGDAFVELDFGRGARLSGRVTRGGRPVARARVTPYPVIEQDRLFYGALTSAQGEYAVEGLANGEHRVRVEGYPSRFVHVAGDTVFNIELPDADLLGHVLEERGKAPIVGAEVELRHVDPATRSRWLGKSNHLGQFALRGVEAGDFLLTVHRPGYDMFRERIAFSASSSPLTIRLHRGGGVEIRVREAGSGKALQRVYVVEAAGENRLSSLWVDLDKQGVGGLPGALVGSTLAFGAEGYAEVLVRDWGGDELDLQLTPAP